MSQTNLPAAKRWQPDEPTSGSADYGGSYLCDAGRAEAARVLPS